MACLRSIYEGAILPVLVEGTWIVHIEDHRIFSNLKLDLRRPTSSDGEDFAARATWQLKLDSPRFNDNKPRA